jgi:hypothetical protein
MTDYTGEPIWRETITGPDDQETATADSINDVGVLLADRTAYLRAIISQLAGVFEQENYVFSIANSDFVPASDIGLIVTLDGPGHIVALAQCRLISLDTGAQASIRLSLWLGAGIPDSARIRVGPRKGYVSDPDLGQYNPTLLAAWNDLPAGVYTITFEAGATLASPIAIAGPVLIAALSGGEIVT